MILMLTGCATVYFLWTMRAGATILLTVWIVLSVCNNFLYYYTFHAASVVFPVAGGVLAIVVTPRIIKSLNREFTEKPDSDSVQSDLQ